MSNKFSGKRQRLPRPAVCTKGPDPLPPGTSQCFATFSEEPIAGFNLDVELSACDSGSPEESNVTVDVDLELSTLLDISTPKNCSDEIGIATLEGPEQPGEETAVFTFHFASGAQCDAQILIVWKEEE